MNALLYGKFCEHLGGNIYNGMMLVHLSATGGPITVDGDHGGLAVRSTADVLTLRGESMFDQNTPEEPERTAPRASRVEVQGGRATLTLAPYSLTRVTFHLEKA